MNLHENRKLAKSMSMKCSLCGKTLKEWASDDMQNSYLTFLCSCNYSYDGIRHSERLSYINMDKLMKKI